MKLKALDQLHVSSVKSDSLRPGEEFVVGNAVGAELLKAHPSKFEKLSDEEPAASDTKRADPAPISAVAKAEPAPPNKAEPAAPANKATNRRKRNS